MEMDQLTWIVAALLALSEGVALIPGLKSNSVFQLIYFILKAVATAVKKKEV